MQPVLTGGPEGAGADEVEPAILQVESGPPFRPAGPH